VCFYLCIFGIFFGCYWFLFIYLFIYSFFFYYSYVHTSYWVLTQGFALSRQAHSFLLSSPLPLVPILNTGPVLPSCSPFFKKWHFCLVKIAIQDISLWCFHAYMYYNANWFIPSIFLLSTLVPFLSWFQQI
jgi:hypothetical protein